MPYEKQEVKELFTKGAVSQAGRATETHLNTLCQQLGVNCDPCFDYSEVIARHAELARKKAKSVDDEPPQEPTGPLAALHNALRDADVAEHHGEQEARAETPPLLRHRAKVKPQWPFVNQSRDAMHKHLVANQFAPPPPGTYRPRDKFPEHEPVTKERVMTTNFDFHPTNESILKTRAREEREAAEARGEFEEKGAEWWRLPATSIEVSEEYWCSSFGPESACRPKMLAPEIKKQLPRPDLGKQSSIVYNINTFDEGALTQDLNTSSFKRQPEWDFRKLKQRSSPALSSFFQPGQYKPDYNSVGRRDDDPKMMKFEKQQKRPNPEDGAGRNKPPKESSYGRSLIPDRSLHRKTSVLSTIPRVLTIDLGKQLARPSMVQRKVMYNENDPAMVQATLERERDLPWHELYKVVCPRSDYSPSYARSIRRDQATLGTRMAGVDPAMIRARKPPPVTQTEMLPVEAVDSDLARPRILQKDFKLMPQRYHSKLYQDHAARYKEPTAPKFERDLHANEQRADLLALSPDCRKVQTLRGDRSFEALSDWDVFCEN